MRRVSIQACLLLSASAILVGCSSQREFSGWSVPKVNPFGWFKKDSTGSGVTKPSEIAAGSRTQVAPGYASVSSGPTSTPAPGTGAYPGGQPSISPPAGTPWPASQPPTWSNPQSSALPGPQVGYYDPSSYSGGVRVADRSSTTVTSPTPSGNYGSAWTPPTIGTSVSGGASVSPSYNQGAISPVGVVPQSSSPWGQSTGPQAYPGSVNGSGAPPASWQGGSYAPTGPRYDINASRYNLSGAPSAGSTTSVTSGVAGSPNAYGTSTPSQPWGYTPSSIAPGTASPGRGLAGSTQYGATLPNVSTLGSNAAGSSTMPAGGAVWGGNSAVGQIQPAGFSAGPGAANSFGETPSVSVGRTESAQTWNPGGPTPNMPGRVNYQPGNTGYQPPAPVNPTVPNTDSATGSTPGAASNPGSSSSPFLPGSIRPYVPPSSGTGSPTGAAREKTSEGSSQLGQLSTAAAGSFCTMDGKCF
jgi:hypothetical protein